MSNLVIFLIVTGVITLVIITLILLPITLVLRAIFGKCSSGNTTITQVPSQFRTRRGWGFSTNFYTGSRKLGDFSMKSELYNFKVPSPAPDLSFLRDATKLTGESTKGVLNFDPTRTVLDLEKARGLFIPDISSHFEDVEEIEDNIFE